MEYSFTIGIPTINRWDLLQEAMVFYQKQFPDIKIIIVDNGNQGIPDNMPNTPVYRPGRNLGAAGSWNFICNTAFLLHNKSHVLILNDDIILGKDQDYIQRLISENNDCGFIKGPMHWCAFVISKNTYTLVGQFDEKFYPAYFEDNDYNYRMKLAGVKTMSSVCLNPHVYRNSMTIEKDPALNSRFLENKKYYFNKWGGTPGNEKYSTPFI